MNELIAIVVSLVFGLLAFLVGKRKSSKSKPEPKPPENKAADAAMDSVKEAFEQEVDRIKSATDGDSPATDLADLGNARRR